MAKKLNTYPVATEYELAQLRLLCYNVDNNKTQVLPTSTLGNVKVTHLYQNSVSNEMETIYIGESQLATLQVSALKAGDVIEVSGYLLGAIPELQYSVRLVLRDEPGMLDMLRRTSYYMSIPLAAYDSVDFAGMTISVDNESSTPITVHGSGSAYSDVYITQVTLYQKIY